MATLSTVILPHFTAENGESYTDFPLTYEIAGPTLGSSPIVLVCHALTGNSSVAGPEGWWARLIGPGQTIDTQRCTVLAFNIPGNGYDTLQLPDPCCFSLQDVARLFLAGLEQLGIRHLQALIGASLGGALAWQIAYLSPQLTDLLIPIACDFKASDWLLAQTHIQSLLLAHSSDPLRDARAHAMLCYRTPQSLDQRFQGQRNPETQRPRMIEWLDYHGKALSQRFLLSAYRTMTHLTATIAVAPNAAALARIQAQIAVIAIDSDLLFTYERAVNTVQTLIQKGARAQLLTLYSIHGHDAFLMEYDQLQACIAPLIATRL